MCLSARTSVHTFRAVHCNQAVSVAPILSPCGTFVTTTLLLLCVPQIVERTYINITNAADPLRPEFVDTNVPATNPDLDPLMQVNCPKSLSMNGKCMVNRDTALVLPGTRTRYRLRTGPVPGLFVWHW